MGQIVLWIAVIILILIAAVFLFIKKVPHGWVQFRTGLVLRFMPALDHYPVVQLRNSMEDFNKKRLPQIKKSLPVDTVKEMTIPTRHGHINARIFNDNNSDHSHLIVLIHGGGWCIGSLNTYEEISRRLVIETGLPLVSLDYSLSPEYKFPHAHEECLDAVSWISENSEKISGKNLPLVLVGDSAGGNLVLTTTYDCTPEVRSSIKKIVPVYPAVDSRKRDYYSGTAFANGYYLTEKSIRQFTEAMISSEDHLNDIRLSPIYYPDVDDFPETFVITAEFDPLRDQAEAFAAKLRQITGSVVQKRYIGTIHAFFGLKDFGSRGVEAIQDIGSFIRGEKIRGSSDPNVNIS